MNRTPTCRSSYPSDKQLTPMTTPLFPISVKEKTGFIDAKGRIVIEPRFDFAGSFSEGLAYFGACAARRGKPKQRCHCGP